MDPSQLPMETHGGSAGLEFHIRHMQIEDVEQVFAIDRISFSLPWTERSYRFEITENPHSHLWVAVLDEDPERILGMIVVWLLVDEAHIGSIAVHPDYRRRGIAEALLIRALMELIPSGAVQAMLEVRRSNMPAQAMYHKFGFTVDAIRPRYYRDNNEDALLMTLKPLNPETIRELGSG
jgi:ribosomal-protein-alanine N-acetyltransferase